MKEVFCEDCRTKRDPGELWRVRCPTCAKAKLREYERGRKQARRAHPVCVECKGPLPPNAHKYCDTCWKARYSPSSYKRKRSEVAA